MVISEMLAAINAALGIGGPCGHEIAQRPDQPDAVAEIRAANDASGTHGPDATGRTWPSQTRASAGSVHIVHQVHLKNERVTQPPKPVDFAQPPGSVLRPCGHVDDVGAGQFEPGVGARELLGLLDCLGQLDVASLSIAAGSTWSRGQVWGEVKHLLQIGFVRRYGQRFELTLSASRWAEDDQTRTAFTCAASC